MQEAGADSKLELAFTLADGVEYVRAAQAAGTNSLSIHIFTFKIYRHPNVLFILIISNLK